MALEGVIEPFEAVEDTVTKMGRSCLHVPDPRHLWMVGHDDDRASSSISAVKPRGLDLVQLQRRRQCAARIQEEAPDLRHLPIERDQIRQLPPSNLVLLLLAICDIIPVEAAGIAITVPRKDVRDILAA